MSKELKKNKIKILINTIIIILLFYLTEKTAIYNTLIPKRIIIYSGLGVSLLLFIYITVIKRKLLNKSSLLLTIIIISVFLCSSIINDTLNLNNLVFIIIVLDVFFLANYFELHYFLYGICNAIIFLSITSIIGTYILHPLYMSGKIGIFYEFNNIENTPFVNMYFCFPLAWTGIQRNYGIFNEPGSFQFFLIFALIIETIYIKRNEKLGFLIRSLLLFTIISTFSTAAYFSILLFYLFYFAVKYIDLKKNSINFKNFLFKISIILLFILLFILLLNSEKLYHLIYRTIFEKLMSGNSDGSFFVRFNSPLQILQISIYNPIFGLTFNKAYNLVYDIYYNGILTDITGTFMIYAVGLGYPLAIVLLIYFYKSLNLLTQNKFLLLGVFLSLFFSSMSQNFVLNILFLLIIYSPFMRKKSSLDKDFRRV